MKTVRDHIATRSDMPAPPMGATHVLRGEGSAQALADLALMEQVWGDS